jgi:hypothetical protein
MNRDYGKKNMNDETKPIGSYVISYKEYSLEIKAILGGNVEGRIKKGEIPIYNDSLYMSGYCNEDKTDYAVYRGKELLGTFTEDYKTNVSYYYSWNGNPCSKKEFYSKLDLEVKLEKEKYEQRLKEEKHE